MKKLAILSVALLLTGCSVFGGKKDDNLSVTSEFNRGEIKITYNWKGELESIEATGTAKVSSNLPGSIDEAASIAVVRARRSISEFIKVGTESDRFVSTISDSLQEANTDLPNSVKSKIAYEVKENMKNNSSAILQGTYIDTRRYDSGTKTVVVTIKSGPKDISTAKQIGRLMGN